MKRIFLFSSLFVLLVVNNLQAQKEGWRYRFSGFVDPQLFLDSRQVICGREGEMLFYPAPRLLDADGKDINAQPSLNMLAITTRMGFGIQAPDWNATRVSAYIEGDFTGSVESGINMLRLRHAYLQLNKSKSTLLLGQYWHPLVVPELMPGTRPLNMGVPFHPYSRYVQANYTYLSRHWRITAVTAFQLDNASDGPQGKQTQYLRNSCLPEFNLQLRYLWNSGQLGVMAHETVIKPRQQVTDSRTQKTYRTETLFSSTAFSLFVKQRMGLWQLNLQALYGDNLYEQGLLGGYIESPFDTLTHRYSYKPFGCATVWADFRRNTGIWRPGLFLGYGINTEFGETVADGGTVYGRGFDLDRLWRVQPQLGFYPAEWLNFFAEIEYTEAKYGEKVTLGQGYFYRSSYSVSNVRFILAAVLNF